MPLNMKHICIRGVFKFNFMFYILNMVPFSQQCKNKQIQHTNKTNTTRQEPIMARLLHPFILFHSRLPLNYLLLNTAAGGLKESSVGSQGAKSGEMTVSN